MNSQSRLVLRCLLVLAASLAVSCGGAKKESALEEPSSGEPSAEEDANSYMSQGGLALSEGDVQGALGNYVEAAKKYDQIGKVTLERAEAHFLAADLAYQIGDRELSLEHYDAASKIFVRFSGNSKVKAANALTNMGVIYKELEQKSDARSAWESALEIYRSLPPEIQNKRNMAKIQQNISDLKEGF